MTDDKRYWLVELDELTRRKLVADATQTDRLIALVDEKAGGIIAYVLPGFDKEVLNALNASAGQRPMRPLGDWEKRILIRMQQTTKTALDSGSGPLSERAAALAEVKLVVDGLITEGRLPAT